MSALHFTSAPIISTNRAKCRDCYRCVRVCPVKAIRMKQGQAQVVEERCIYCGTCVRECPQKAKVIRDDTTWVQEILATHKRVAASMAPTYPAAFAEHEVGRLASALRKLGFSLVAETAVGAEMVARQTSRWLRETDLLPSVVVTSACPVVVRYVELYAPESVEKLAPIVSPMIAHARLLREQHGADAVVFIGPCIAKKYEAMRGEYEGDVDCVLTFAELRLWLQREGIDFESLEESRFDHEAPASARYFALAGGQKRAADETPDMLEPSFLAITGPEGLHEALSATAVDAPTVIEQLFCQGGCIGGVGCPNDIPFFERRRRILHHATRGAAGRTDLGLPNADDWTRKLKAQFQPAPVDRMQPSEDSIRRALARIGKLDSRDQLDCGACGYRSCREKAIAVIRGLAEPEMCMPRMRLLAERRTDRIIETSPNGIVILDHELHILAMNPAFQRIFMCSAPVLGRHISYLTDPAPFEQVAANRSTKVERTIKDSRYGRVFHQIVYALDDEEQIVGIFVDVTESTLNREKLMAIHREALQRSRELLQHQVQMAQDITRLIAEHTARGEELVKNLVEAALVEPGAPTSEIGEVNAGYAQPLRGS
ncbi:MAG: 4Fe-4S binding protein [Candidatus Sumerlaeaceae bacterium]|nr:4Fe-4S binding protein [Candidatus Sumerlaeaceae bacterium]